MAKQKWKGVGLFFGGHDISGAANELSLDPEMPVVETTNFRSRGFRDTTTVMLGMKASLKGFIEADIPVESLGATGDTDAVAPVFSMVAARSVAGLFPIGTLSQWMMEPSTMMFKSIQTVGDVQRFEAELGLSGRFGMNGRLAAFVNQESALASGGEIMSFEAAAVENDLQITAILHCFRADAATADTPTLVIALERGKYRRGDAGDFGAPSAVTKTASSLGSVADVETPYLFSQTAANSSIGSAGGTTGPALVWKTADGVYYAIRKAKILRRDSKQTTIDTDITTNAAAELGSVEDGGRWFANADEAAGHKNRGFITVGTASSLSVANAGTHVLLGTADAKTRAAVQSIQTLYNLATSNAQKRTRSFSFSAVTGAQFASIDKGSDETHQILELNAENIGSSAASDAGWWRVKWTKAGSGNFTKIKFGVVLDLPDV